MIRKAWGIIATPARRWQTRRRLQRRFPDAVLREGVRIRSPSRLELGAGVVIDTGVVLHCGGMGWAPDGFIRVGGQTYIGPNAVLFGGGGIEIGRGCLISPGVVIASHQHTFARRDLDIRHQPLEFGTVTLEDDVWIGANATVLPGIRIGKGAVIGAGAVVTRDVGSGVVAVGVPARAVRER